MQSKDATSYVHSSERIPRASVFVDAVDSEEN